MVALGEVTKNGQTIFAKNSDRSANECQPLVQCGRLAHPPGAVTQCQFISLPEVSTTCRHVGSRPYWCWGYEHGFNEYQVVIGNEGLTSRIESAEPRLIGMELLRIGLERSRTAGEAVEVMTEIITRYGQGVFKGGAIAGNYDNGYLVADPREAYVIETAGHQWAVKRVEKTIGISNVYSLETDWDCLSPEAEPYAIQQGWWKPGQGRFNFAEAYSDERFRSGGGSNGAARRARSCTVLSQQVGGIEATTMMSLLSDHSDGKCPDEPFQTEIGYGGICFHTPEGLETGGNTAASLVADLCGDGSRLPVYWCSFYSPCLGVFFPVLIEGTLPSVLSIGDASPSDTSPWWLFHRLSQLARAEAEKRVPFVREQWAKLQARFLESAYPIAHEGCALIENEQSDAAERLLTEYMEQNVLEMLEMASGMIHSFA